MFWSIKICILKVLLVYNFVLKTVGVALPNIIMNEEFVIELTQQKMTLKNVINEMNKLLYDNNYRERMTDKYNQLEKLMGEPGCSERAAKKMIALLK